jgi:hypothetical protein
MQPRCLASRPRSGTRARGNAPHSGTFRRLTPQQVPTRRTAGHEWGFRRVVSAFRTRGSATSVASFQMARIFSPTATHHVAFSSLAFCGESSTTDIVGKSDAGFATPRQRERTIALHRMGETDTGRTISSSRESGSGGPSHRQRPRFFSSDTRVGGNCHWTHCAISHHDERAKITHGFAGSRGEG